MKDDGKMENMNVGGRKEGNGDGRRGERKGGRKEVEGVVGEVEVLV